MTVRERLFGIRAAGVVFAAVIALAAAGCGDDDADTPEPTDPTAGGETQALDIELPPALESSGVIRIGTSFNFPPLNFKNDENEYDGAEPALMDELGAKLGLDIERVETNFAGLLPGLEASRFDIITSGMNDTDERREQVDFVNYLRSGTSVMVQAGNPEGIQGADDLCGATVGVAMGTTYVGDLEGFSDECVAEGREPIDVQTLQSGSEVVQALLTGRIHATFANHISNLYFVQESEGQLAVVGEPVNPVYLGIAVPKGDTVLAEAIQAGLNAMIEDGSYQRILSEWGIEDAGLPAILINGEAS